MPKIELSVQNWLVPVLGLTEALPALAELRPVAVVGVAITGPCMASPPLLFCLQLADFSLQYVSPKICQSCLFQAKNLVWPSQNHGPTWPFHSPLAGRPFFAGCLPFPLKISPSRIWLCHLRAKALHGLPNVPQKPTGFFSFWNICLPLFFLLLASTFFADAEFFIHACVT